MNRLTLSDVWKAKLPLRLAGPGRGERLRSNRLFGMASGATAQLGGGSEHRPVLRTRNRGLPGARPVSGIGQAASCLSGGRPLVSRRQPRGYAALDGDRGAFAKPGAPAQPLRTPNTYAKLAAVTMPVLVLAADADLLAPPSMMRAWAAHLKNYEFGTVPESGHSIAWEQPEIFNEKVLAFMTRH